MSDSNQNIQRLARYLKQNPEDTFSKFALALELLKSGQLEKARILFESIYHQDPDYLGTYYHLGKLYQALQRFEDAERCFKEGLELSNRLKNRQTSAELQEALLLLEEEKNDY